MQTGSLVNLIVGGYFFITGTVMVVFHKRLKQMFEDLLAGLPEGVRLLAGGRSLTGMIILTGVLSVLAGLALLVMYFASGKS